jgi:hypothetical protein
MAKIELGFYRAPALLIPGGILALALLLVFECLSPGLLFRSLSFAQTASGTIVVAATSFFLGMILVEVGAFAQYYIHASRYAQRGLKRNEWSNRSSNDRAKAKYEVYLRSMRIPTVGIEGTSYLPPVKRKGEALEDL